MFKISELLNSLDNAAKETLQLESDAPTVSATSLRSAVKEHSQGTSSGALDQLVAAQQATFSSSSVGTGLVADGIHGEDGTQDDASVRASTLAPEKNELLRNSNSNNKSSSSSSSGNNNSSAIRNSSSSSSSYSSSSSSNNSKSAAAPLSRGSGGSSLGSGSDIKAKDDEIERLNGECLELEEQVASLKTEVQEAWNSYQAAQEKAAAREADMQEELRALQKAKKTDKQQILAQITALGNDRDEALRALRAAQTERQDALDQLESARSHEREWHEREAELLSELSEARAGSVQGVQGLRDELRAAAAQMEQLRAESASLLRQSQKRQAELEEANAELSQGLAEKQRELSRMRASVEAGARDESNVREIEALQVQLRALGQQLEDQRELRVAADRRARQLEAEQRASVLGWEDERSRLEARADEAVNASHVLQEKLRALEHSAGGTPQRPSAKIYGGANDDDAYVVVGGASPGAGGTASGGVSEEKEEIKNLVAQVQALSKQLLSKQSAVNDLQAERSALKSRVSDLQARCAGAERQLAALRDLEEDDVAADRERWRDGEVGASIDSGSGVYAPGGFGSAGFGLQQRRKASGGVKAIADLEKMGVHAGPRIAQVVDSIDSWTLVTGKFLRSYPLVRLGFVLYLLVLHLWVFVVLGWQTHSLELDELPVNKRAIGT